MSRQLDWRALGVLLAILGLMWWISPGRTDQTPPPKKAKQTKPFKETHAAKAQQTKGAKSENDTGRLIHKLNQVIDVDKGFDANTPFKEALEFLSDTYDFTILVDDPAFKADLGIAEVVNAPVKLAKIKKVRLGTVLTMLSYQVGGTFLVRSNYVEVTPWTKAMDEVWGKVTVQDSEDTSGRMRPRLPFVHAVIEKRALMEALRDLSDLAGVSVVVDLQRAGEQAQVSVTATLKNVPLDTAVRLLANQADLKTVLVDNVIYVTNQENANALQAEQEKMNASGLAPPTQFRPVAPQGM